jgi:hypothetical protein
MQRRQTAISAFSSVTWLHIAVALQCNTSAIREQATLRTQTEFNRQLG